MSISNLHSLSNGFDLSANSAVSKQVEEIVLAGIGDATFTEKAGCYACEWSSAGPIAPASGLDVAMVIPWTFQELKFEHGVSATLVSPNSSENVHVKDIQNDPAGSRVLFTIYSTPGEADAVRSVRFCVC